MSKKVYLVGAGPGDYRLITLKGLEAIKKADVILYDRLANPRLLDYAREGAELIYVGKAPNRHSMKQEEISQLILNKALEGNVVTRLKGGDPYVFGRGGEEAILLREHDVEFEVVPGITSAISVPSYAGIPVTHRGVSASFHVITGHEDPTKKESMLDYSVLAKLSGTLIFLMGISNLNKICSSLIKYGQSEDRPVAVIRKGTRPEQRAVVGTLGTIVEIVEREGITNPAIILVGDVVNLREDLNWFEELPMHGKNILVTRARAQNSRLCDRLESLGSNAIEFPTIQVRDYEDSSKAQTLKNIRDYGWIIFTSVNGVEYFFKSLRENRMDARALYNAKIVAIGPATAKAVENRGIMVDYIPQSYVAESVIEAIKNEIKAGDKVLLPRALEARSLIIDELTEMGLKVDNLPIYETVIPEADSERLNGLIKENNIDVITVTSSSTAKNLVKLVSDENRKALNSIPVVSIGPITTDTAMELGLNVVKTADEYTIEGFLDALNQYLSIKGEA